MPSFLPRRGSTRIHIKPFRDGYSAEIKRRRWGSAIARGIGKTVREALKDAKRTKEFLDTMFAGKRK